jgi:hypothetical protein
MLWRWRGVWAPLAGVATEPAAEAVKALTKRGPEAAASDAEEVAAAAAASATGGGAAP